MEILDLQPPDITLFVSIAIGVMFLLIISFLFAFNISQQKKLQYHKDLQVLHNDQQQMLIQQNTLLEQRVQERTSQLSSQKQTLQDALNNLEASQKLLIQSEKMASLGELTAGIAHEIQNPLNFVNNFSEVNKDLLIEMKQAIDMGDIEDAKAIAGDVITNEEKINEHGRRADAIVKGMLLHSKASTGQKEPTKINDLISEFLRLSYNTLRAKDKNFAATLETDFDESIDKVTIVPQDVSRVLLNLFNNAFYAVNERKQQLPGTYQPAVAVSTRKIGNAVEISITDNGVGIPANITDKIFHPFFTTKPTGQGTGLGLSLSYDIIKAHGGQIKVQSKEGEGAAFTIKLPL